MQVRKLVVADSDDALVETLAAYFRARGVEVKTAYDGLTVLKLLHVAEPDAVCLSTELQCDNGRGICELLSDQRRFAHLPVVLMARHADDWLSHDCRDLQAYYVVKGPELARRVATLIEESAYHAPLVAVD